MEYDLAEVNKEDLNPIVKAWKEVHPVKGKKLEETISTETDAEEKIKMIWLEVCKSSQNSKCEFMEKLISLIEENNLKIKCPLYIENAIKHVIGDDGKEQLSK